MATVALSCRIDKDCVIGTQSLQNSTIALERRNDTQNYRKTWGRQGGVTVKEKRKNNLIRLDTSHTGDEAHSTPQDQHIKYL